MGFQQFFNRRVVVPMARICMQVHPTLSCILRRIERDIVILQELEHNTGVALPDANPEPGKRGCQDGFSRETITRAADQGPRLDPSRIYGVLIGIDGYSFYPLRGCVADALAMKKYLIECLHVPNERIQCLLGPVHYGDTSTDVSSLSPSRANILSVLLGLITSPDIEYGDPIIIFFAGHGTRYLLSNQTGPDDNKARNDNDCPPRFVEAFCPMDHDSRATNGVPIPDISDREVNTILSQISSEKGSRITCILDCCHAGSITRTLNSNVRTSTPLDDASLEEMLFTAERNLKDLPGYRSILEKDWEPDMNSHVVLAACKRSELARTEQMRKEDGTMGWGGVFTGLLIDALKSDGLREGATYEDLIDLIKALSPAHFQTPCVAGERKNKRLWYQC